MPAEYIDDDGNFMFFLILSLKSSGILENAVVKLAEKQRIQYCAMVVRRSTYEKVGGYIAKNIGCEILGNVGQNSIPVSCFI
ncbi:MAG: hypothetical protein R3A12_15720 [Ignavibacteria bacterium]